MQTKRHFGIILKLLRFVNITLTKIQKYKNISSLNIEPIRIDTLQFLPWKF